LVQLRDIKKTFPGVVALSDVSLDIYAGEVHALVGENGAGKSTLIKILLGAYVPTAGSVSFDSREVSFATPFDASKLGIEGVQQELMLVPWLSVKQNVFLGREIRRGPLGGFDLRAMGAASEELLAGFGLDIDVNRPVKQYAPSIWKMIDIARVINLKPRVIVFDEPTAILTQKEVDSLFSRIAELKKSGAAVVYISHRLEEIRQIADRVTVLRDGGVIETRPIGSITDDQIVKMMVGRDVAGYYSRTIVEPGEELVSFRGVSLRKGQKDIDLSVSAGEIVGLAGLVGSGRTEVAEAIVGINKVIAGELRFRGESCAPKDPAAMIKRGVSIVPENRKYLGLILKFSVALNSVLSVFKSWTRVVYGKKREAELADRMIDRLSIKTPSRDQIVGNLSGGNQQKVVLAKALLADAKLLILDEPTVGVDVGAKEEIHKLMDSFVGEGGGILMISSDLPEVIGMCDRVYIMYEGRIVKHLARRELSSEAIAEYMLGAKKGERL